MRRYRDIEILQFASQHPHPHFLYTNSINPCIRFAMILTCNGMDGLSCPRLVHCLVNSKLIGSVGDRPFLLMQPTDFSLLAVAAGAVGDVEIPPLLLGCKVRQKVPLLDFSSERLLPPPSLPSNFV